MAQGIDWILHLLTFHEQGLQRDNPPEPTAIYTPDRKAYKSYWHKVPPFRPGRAARSSSSTTSRSQGD